MSPLVIKEAFAAGIPVLASNVYGNAEQINDGKNGWLFKFNDSDALKTKLQQLIDDPFLVEIAQKNLELEQASTACLVATI
jgi:glycosyltransferase involved in cell wall biosynthesis